MFDTSKIKTFKLSDLAERVLTIKRFTDTIDNIEMIVALDFKTGDCFVLEINHIPQ